MELLDSIAAAIGTELILDAVSLYANRRFRAFASLPMQWRLDGTPNWYAPRWLAISFMPWLAGLILGGIALTLGAARIGLVEICLLAPVFIAAHLLHVWLIGRALRQPAHAEPPPP